MNEFEKVKEDARERHREGCRAGFWMGVILLGMLGIVAWGRSEAQEFVEYYNGEKWLTTASWSIQDCPDFSQEITESVMDEMSPVPHFRASTGAIHITCSPTPPPVALLRALADGTAFDEKYSIGGNAKWTWQTATLGIFKCAVWINSTFSNTEQEYRKFIGHELGHCFGLQHNPNPFSMMYATPLVNDLRAADKQQLEILYYGCRVGWIDENLNLYVVSELNGTLVHGLMTAGGIWPDQAFSYGECK